MNYVWIVVDDMRVDHLTYMPTVRQRLEGCGRRYTTCRVNVPLCQPSRVGMLSGQYSKRHNVTTNTGATITGGIPSNFDRNNTIAKWLDTAGFRTAMLGKYLNGETVGVSKPTGWDTWRQLLVTMAGYVAYDFEVYDGTSTLSPEGSATDYLGDEALTFMAGSEPWFLYLTPVQPHWPWNPDEARRFAWGGVRWTNLEANVYPLQFDVWQASGPAWPSWVEAKPALTSADRATIDTYARGFMRAATTLDAMIARLLDAVDWSDTTVIFCSDNGVMLGEYGYFGTAIKNLCYEPCMRVPLIVRGPNFPVGEDANLTTLQDITATICAIEGITPPIAQDGVDLRSTSPSRELLHELGDATGSDVAPRPIADGITTSVSKLFRYAATGIDKYEMYLMNNSQPYWPFFPYEDFNLAQEVGQLSVRNALEAQLDTLLA